MSLRSRLITRLIAISGLSGLYLLLPWDFDIGLSDRTEPASRNYEGRLPPCQLELPFPAPSPGTYQLPGQSKVESLDGSVPVREAEP
jgi:hypothetical protein